MVWEIIIVEIRLSVGTVETEMKFQTRYSDRPASDRRRRVSAMRSARPDRTARWPP